MYEHTSSGLAAALFAHYFSRWHVVPEVNQKNRKRPDFVLSGLYRNTFYPKIVVEIKKHKGDSFDKIFDQMDLSGLQTLGEQNELGYAESYFHGSNLYHIAIRGTQIAFMERLHFSDYSAIIPLTQPSTDGMSNSQTLMDLQQRMHEDSNKSKDFTFP